MADIIRKRQQRFNKLPSAVTSYTYSVELENNFPVSTKYSPSCAATTGYTPEEYIATPSLWIEIVHPNDRDEVRQHMAKILRHATSPSIEHRVLHKDGSTRWVRSTIVGHWDEAGTLVRYDGLVEDITDRKRDAVRLRSVLESAPDATFLVDQNGQILMANAEAERVFGYCREELLQQPVEILLPDRFHKDHPAQRAEYSTAPRPVLLHERGRLVAGRKDGSGFPVEIALSPIDAGTPRNALWRYALARLLLRASCGCVPLVAGGDLLGVINLYVKHGHNQSPEKERLLSAVADVVWKVARFHLAFCGMLNSR